MINHLSLLLLLNQTIKPNQILFWCKVQARKWLLRQPLKLTCRPKILIKKKNNGFSLLFPLTTISPKQTWPRLLSAPKPFLWMAVRTTAPTSYHLPSTRIPHLMLFKWTTIPCKSRIVVASTYWMMRWKVIRERKSLFSLKRGSRLGNIWLIMWQWQAPKMIQHSNK